MLSKRDMTVNWLANLVSSSISNGWLLPRHILSLFLWLWRASFAEESSLNDYLARACHVPSCGFILPKFEKLSQKTKFLYWRELAKQPGSSKCLFLSNEEPRHVVPSTPRSTQVSGVDCSVGVGFGISEKNDPVTVFLGRAMLNFCTTRLKNTHYGYKKLHRQFHSD